MIQTTRRHCTENENTTAAKLKGVAVEDGRGLTGERCSKKDIALSTSRLSLTRKTGSVHARPISQSTKKRKWQSLILGIGRTCLTRILGAGSGTKRLRTLKKTTTYQAEKNSIALSNLTSPGLEACGETIGTRGLTLSYPSRLIGLTTLEGTTQTTYSSLHDAIMSRRPGRTKHINAVNNTLTRRPNG